ncbi:hypothetical protein NP493_169g04003 [Ridgeia piscesae]|uniref:Mannosyltransferase n=1 Tax=Ridgeia piscesae TaxID=27915 RepID=A0AAD9UF99_RIDPI|nr:hypothetical protein NP493_169g04003 [Ridgeia piscesae]
MLYSGAEEKPILNVPWTPTTYTALKALLSARLCAAIWSNISDCDETYNYWEPMHHLMHGYGYQTWEYSPAYAIRSYAYLWLYILPLRLYTNLAQANRMLQFYFLRCFLSFICAICEVTLYRAVTKHFGANTGRLTLCFLIFGSGMFVAGTAFIPSTFAMYLVTLAVAGWFTNQLSLAVFGIAAAAIVGWPFAAALGIPIAADYLFRRGQIVPFMKWSLLSATICLVPMVYVDSSYFGKLVIAPLNIVKYNVFSDHGPDIYGTEPLSFYFVNGFINFNGAFGLALMALPVALLVQYFLGQKSRDIPLWLSLAPMYVWMLIFFSQPHKEERFLFPVYTLICVNAAVALDHLQKLLSYLIGGHKYRHYTESSNWLGVVACIGFVVISISRILALYFGYHAPLDVYGEMNQIVHNPKLHTLTPGQHVNVCVGKEWYRFPSHFFLPDKWHLKFIKSEFRGQLPKPYDSGENSTSIIPSHMNDMNREETSRYTHLSQCQYLVDVDLPSNSPYEPRYSENKRDWTVVTSAKFLDSSRSHRFFRAFYLPFLTSKHCTYVDYNLLRSTRPHRAGEKQ